MTLETLKQKLHDRDLEIEAELGDFSECSDEN